MSLLNSSSTRYLIESQVIGASVVRRFNLEPISLGYMVVGQSETAVAAVGRAKHIPFSKVDLATDYALAAQYLGMRFVYLEAGSGAEHMVDPRMVSKVSERINVPLIVGGGIRRSEEHTSELQSRQYLVCRLLLEKKKTNRSMTSTTPVPRS